MHHDANRGKLRLRCPRAPQANVAVGVDRERGGQVVAVRCVDESFLEQGAVAGPDLEPEHAAPGIERVLRGIAGVDAAAMGVYARRSSGLVGA